MLEDKEGFLYPSINGKCKKCGLLFEMMQIEDRMVKTGILMY